MRFDYLLVFFNIFTGKGPTFIYHSFASSSYLYLRASSCACDILCSNNYFWRSKGKFLLTINSIWPIFIMLMPFVLIFSFLPVLC